MAKTNIKQTIKNHEGAKSFRLSDYATLERLVLANMLFEDQFYVDGQQVAGVISQLISKVDPKFVQNLALKARTDMKLRHIPLFLLCELAHQGKLEASSLEATIQRPDEIGEFLALYWKERKQPLSNQVKRGLAAAFNKFNEYEFAKWDKGSAQIKLRDAMFLTHPKPVTLEQAQLFKKIAEKSLTTPDTWETELSSGANKCETFTRLMQEKRLGALAFLRNLRNMQLAGVSYELIREYSESVKTDRVLPFRFVTAFKTAPAYRCMLEQMMLKSLGEHTKLSGKTVLLVDISGSMFGSKVSKKSDLDRYDAAAALAMLAREICEDVEIYTFSNNLVRIDSCHRGFALLQAMKESQPNRDTELGKALRSLKTQGSFDRCIVFTDEESSDAIPSVPGKKYMVNVASYENSIANDSWVRITGFSEAVIDYIQKYEESLQECCSQPAY